MLHALKHSLCESAVKEGGECKVVTKNGLKPDMDVGTASFVQALRHPIDMLLSGKHTFQMPFCLLYSC